MQLAGRLTEFIGDLEYQYTEEKMNKVDKGLMLIPKYNLYMEYMIDVILKLPRTEKFNIGNEYKNIMYEGLQSILYINKLETKYRLSYLNKIDAELNIQRILLRIMVKNKWIDEKKFNVAINQISEIGKIVGGLIKAYGKNSTK